MDSSYERSMAVKKFGFLCITTVAGGFQEQIDAKR